ncbi:hypothetical protein [Phenylobacterium kunshanense]|uniref:Uncharacterized protein n=1 Tax=Phenylobacterium kunshanense TaxID=1445034 RepID=A0A328BNT1_9CAUL|nr:hypothetical protein [Phenylobacterium kunshanense]RAK68763.1 hypothetical protein DJ019_01770 [Phenylobacterium kunshanense]
MTNEAEGLDLDALEKVARDATPGSWEYRAVFPYDWGWVTDGDGAFIAQIKDPRVFGGALDMHRADKTDPWAANATHVSTFDPPTVLRLLAALRAQAERVRVLEGDANRWRALMRCGRIQMQGSSGVDPNTGERNGNNVHFGAEFWPERHDKYPDLIEGHDRSTAWGKACLVALVDAIMEQEAARALLPATQAEGEKP